VTRLVPGVAAALLLLAPLPASAHFFGRYRTAQYAAYYYPVPVYYTAPRVVFVNPAPVAVAPVVAVNPAPVVCPPAPVPVATPYPAPPSGVRTAEPPVVPPPAQPMPRAPGVRESGYSEAYTGGGSGGGVRPAGQRVSVSFWNLTGRDLTLTAGGQTAALPRGKCVTLSLNREFVWQANGREPKLERVPPSESALEVLIRR